MESIEFPSEPKMNMNEIKSTSNITSVSKEQMDGFLASKPYILI